MNAKPLGPCGMHASALGLGTWVLGGGMVWGEYPDDIESVRVIHAALDAGINLIMDRVLAKDEFRANEAWNPWFAPANRHHILDLLGGWSDLTVQHDFTPAQLVLAWTLAQPGVTHVLCGARTFEQLRDNAARRRHSTLTGYRLPHDPRGGGDRPTLE